MARTAEFDRKEVLQRAMELFWQKGYCKCSMSCLVEATRLKPGSIYAAFRSKEGLFLEALEYYGRRSIQQLDACLKKAGTPLAGIRLFIEMIASSIEKGERQHGCFLVNTILEHPPENNTVTGEVNRYLRAIETRIHGALVSALNRGELPGNKNPDVLVKFLMVNIWGLQVLAKTNPNKETVRAVLGQILENLQGDI
ncbi:TetR/AcrR family transcriptional regulator [Desulfomarina sp.]